MGRKEEDEIAAGGERQKSGRSIAEGRRGRVRKSIDEEEVAEEEEEEEMEVEEEEEAKGRG